MQTKPAESATKNKDVPQNPSVDAGVSVSLS